MFDVRCLISPVGPVVTDLTRVRATVHDRCMAQFHCGRSDDLFGVSKARGTTSSLQRVVEVQFRFREHYDDRRHC